MFKKVGVSLRKFIKWCSQFFGRKGILVWYFHWNFVAIFVFLGGASFQIVLTSVRRGVANCNKTCLCYTRWLMLYCIGFFETYFCCCFLSCFFLYINSFLLLYVMCYFKVVIFLSAFYFRVLLFRFFPLDECCEDKGVDILIFLGGEKETGSRTLLRQK